MKKRIRKTGEIVDVISFNDYSTRERDANVDWVSYIDSKGIEHKQEKGLNIYWDFENVEKLTKEIDWEQVRINAAISALQGFASNPNNTSATDEELALWSVRAADYLIAELKKGGNK